MCDYRDIELEVLLDELSERVHQIAADLDTAITLCEDEPDLKGLHTLLVKARGRIG